MNWWVRLWDQQERPTVQAIVRLLLGAVLLLDLLTIGWLDLVVPLLGAKEIGGFSAAFERANAPWFYDVFPAAAWSAWVLWAGLALSCATLTIGFYTRTSAVVLLLLSAQAALILPPADRGIDLLIRNVLAVLVFSSAGRSLSLDARLATGSWRGDGQLVPAWPRHLLILQIVVMYFSAGIYKAAYLWTPMGHFDALYVILQDPAVARFDWSWLVHEPFLTLTRIGSAVTVVWEYSAPLVLLVYYWKLSGRGGRIGRWAVRARLHLWWLAVGVVFHLGIALTLNLGIFPWAMLALYPLFLHPDELPRLRPAGATSPRPVAAVPR